MLPAERCHVLKQGSLHRLGFIPDSAVESRSWGGSSGVGCEWEGGHERGRLIQWRRRGRIGLAEVPVHLHRNRQPLRKRPQTLEKRRPLLRGHGEPDSQPPRCGNQIGPDQKDPIAPRLQPSCKPARGEYGLAEPHQHIIAHTAGSARRIRGVERLKTERI